MREDSRADSVKYLELCDKYFIGWTAETRSTLRFGRCIADIRRMSCTPGRAQNPLAGLAAFDANGSRSETMASKVLLRYF